MIYDMIFKSYPPYHYFLMFGNELDIQLQIITSLCLFRKYFLLF